MLDVTTHRLRRIELSTKNCPQQVEAMICVDALLVPSAISSSVIALSDDYPSNLIFLDLLDVRMGPEFTAVRAAVCQVVIKLENALFTRTYQLYRFSEINMMKLIKRR
jgi:hypothetical protein